nr:glycosyltransferase family 2 protein [uncultured Brevundimonas sp.]
MQILLPLAGPSDFFPVEQYFFPKPLIEVGGVPMIQRVVEDLKGVGADSHFIFVAHQSDITAYSLDNTLKILSDSSARVVPIANATQGGLCSALMSVDELDPDDELIIANGDQVIDCDYAEVIGSFRAREADVGVITFPSVHPRWSYVRADGAGSIEQAAEKKVISRQAIAGFYYFKTARQFVEYASQCMINDARVGGKFFISLTLNEAILVGGIVCAWGVDENSYHSFFSPDKIKTFEDEIMKRALSRGQDDRGLNLVIPAAGEGSRFREAGFAKPKPFIDVNGRAMVQLVIDNMKSSGAKVHLLFRDSHMMSEAESVSAIEQTGAKIHPVYGLTEGTACTILLARKSIDSDDRLLVANSDQYVRFDVDKFVEDADSRNLDGSILVFRDDQRNPKWSFARVGDDGLVLEVAEKKPISDLATVGVYLFNKGSEFVSAAIDMIARNDRVNGEFYTCPVYNYMIRNGARIGVYEVDVSDMYGLGTPPDLASYLAQFPS